MDTGDIETLVSGLHLIKPDPKRHSPITLSWFQSSDGRETLLLMGNAEHEIQTPSLATETQILKEFVSLEEARQQLTWMISYSDKIIGVAWIELVENHGVKPPSLHLMIGDKQFRGRGIGKATMSALITYVKEHLSTNTIYSRHLKSNEVVAHMNEGLGFVNDGEPYNDENGLVWQNVILAY